MGSLLGANGVNAPKPVVTLEWQDNKTGHVTVRIQNWAVSDQY